MNNSKVTFIVTVMRDTLDVKECVKSILRQKNIQKEIILVNCIENSSKVFLDNLQDEADLKKHVDYYINPYRLSSLGEKRNNALTYATGDYIQFLNSDDFLARDSIQIAVESGVSNNSDVVISRSLLLNDKDKSFAFKKNIESLKGKSTISKEGISLEICEDFYLYNKLFKRDFIVENNIKFSDTNYYDYLEFVTKSICLASNISTNPMATYIEKIRFGLDKMKNQKHEEKIDIKQLDDMVKIFETIDEIDNSMFRQAIEERGKSFILDRGLNYVNICDSETLTLNKISKILEKINLKEDDICEKNYKKLSFIKNKEYDKYFKFLEERRISSEKHKSYKTYLKYTFFKEAYNVLKKIPVKKNSVLLLSHSPGMDGNFEYIEEEIKRYNKDVPRRDRFIVKKAGTQVNTFKRIFMPLKLARAKNILLCENVPFFQHLDVRKDTNVIQTWHAAGAFKKFGFSTEYMEGGPDPFRNKKMNIHMSYNYATVSSKEVARHYAEAFKLDVDKVIPVGVPRADFFFDENKVSATKDKVYKLYPKLQDKKVILYAPTFRGSGKKRINFTLEFDVNKVAREISDDYVIALKLHPSVKSSNIKIDEDLKDKIINCSEYKEANDILTVTDILITDYSSIIFDYSLLNKPMIFYAYDLEEYILDRDFYYEYEGFVPGPIAKTNDEIINVINDNNFDLKVVGEFCDKFFVAKDGNNSKRFVNALLEINKKGDV